MRSIFLLRKRSEQTAHNYEEQKVGPTALNGECQLEKGSTAFKVGNWLCS